MSKDKGLSNKNIWAPWRTEYIMSLGEMKDDGDCFVCDARDSQDDAANLVVWRGPNAIAILNRYPYTGGHTLVCPNAHVADLDDMDEATHLECMTMLRDVKRVMAAAINPHGFNIGCNLGAPAGAGLPGHVHWHVVPRWVGDTNYLEVLAQTRIVPVSLEQLHTSLVDAARQFDLPWAIAEV
jgi:ATP adenylyltransferase